MCEYVFCRKYVQRLAAAEIEPESFLGENKKRLVAVGIEPESSEC